ncbi:triosephosphate isomerase [Desulfitobacterium dichloroeliminans LMG P-21439]|uniref:Triosephosphate isomerase n=1 Tax=Desulfitobacterium dichloroeliminans (strain LMG P-21439 / DCA1) TaxID=871963 RepID=L0FCM4_DESDL|nr:triose-phosphate isomerase [Desulfitobacterium dichloroeliminans]AGA70760.1 triosephosphate isomerase [Desulfitobacterium dichloroeliminans LMG P-21439]
MSIRHPIIAGNWKMNKTIREAQDYAGRLLGLLGETTEIDVVVCAPFTALSTLKDELEESVIHIGAQDLSFAGNGAYTGEISAAMLVDTACTYVIIGHSERRVILRETDEEIAKKVKAALKAGLTPILCVGENLAQREESKAFAIVRSQVEKDLPDLSPADLKRVVIAYEPIWAIGTGKSATSADAQEMCTMIRSTLAGIAGAVADEVNILYGGSVNADTIVELMAQPDVDGALVGGASLDPEGFAKLVLNAVTAL